jgi:hypothetical protein
MSLLSSTDYYLSLTVIIPLLSYPKIAAHPTLSSYWVNLMVPFFANAAKPPFNSGSWFLQVLQLYQEKESKIHYQ